MKTLFTIGYERKNLPEFIRILKANGIENLIDIRNNNRSFRKPDFSKILLSKALEIENIRYIEKKELGIPKNIMVLFFLALSQTL